MVLAKKSYFTSEHSIMYAHLCGRRHLISPGTIQFYSTVNNVLNK